MSELRSADGKYLCVDQSDGNFVVYLAANMNPVWDRWSWEAGRTSNGPVPVDTPTETVDSGTRHPEDTGPPSSGEPLGGGGLVESISSRNIRPRLNAAEIRRFLPSRGAFAFPAPYGTRAARITNPSDGTVRPIGMSYWPNLNNSLGRTEIRVLVSLDDTLTLFTVDKDSFAVRRGDSLPFHHTGEGCYWSFSDADVLYVQDGARLFAYNVRTHQVSVAVDAPSGIRQCHSSYDGRVHSFTLDGSAAVFRNGTIQPFPARGRYDECQIDKSGRWLLTKIDDDNLVRDLDRGTEFRITNADGAVGHSDMGFGYMVGEEDQSNPGGVFRLWLFGDNGPINGGVMYASDWTGMSRYVSHCNATRSRPENHVALFSSSLNADVPRANELVLAPLDGSGRCTVVCPNLTDVTPTGNSDHDYWQKTRANLDPTGRYACFSGNCGTDRMDIFVIALP